MPVNKKVLLDKKYSSRDVLENKTREIFQDIEQ